MSRRFVLAFVLAALLSGALPFATSARPNSDQGLFESLPGRQVIVRAGHTLTPAKRIPAPLLARALNGQPLAATANIVVTYFGFSLDAQAAFEAAVSVWERMIVSPKVINVRATWKPFIDGGVLAQAGPTNFYRLPSGDRYYPVALYEAICNCESLMVYEIAGDFNSARGDWYLGTDGNTPADKYDLYTVVLHELGHGLGFYSSFEVDGSYGEWGLTKSDGVTYPVGFDLDEWTDATGGNLLKGAYANHSTELKTQLTDGTVYFGGANVVAANGGNRAPLYAPDPWEAGSSNSHFDEAAFPAGNVNALMTPYLDNGEVNHDPGPLTLALFQDIGWSLAGSATAPGQPTGVTATAGNAQALVGWAAPSSNGGSTITGYTATSSPDGLSCTTASLSCTVAGLANGTPYTFTVTATNAVGTSPPSDPSNSVTPSAPAAPANDNFASAQVISGLSGNGSGSNVNATGEAGEPLNTTLSSPIESIWFAWTASASGQATVDLCGSDFDTTLGVYTGSVVGLLTLVATDDDGGCGLTSLVTFTASAGTTYRISVDGYQSEQGAITLNYSLTATSTPGAPTGVSATPGNSQATVSWTAPASNGGSAITSYTVAASPGANTCTWSSGPLTCTVTGLTNGQGYTFTVTATNTAGPGPASAPSGAVTPRTAPGAPTGVSVTPGNASAAASWTAPASNGGSPITAYTVTGSPGGSTCTWSSGPLSCIVTGLTNGQSYTFTVIATNDAGTGPGSAPSAAVTPTAPPSGNFRPDGRIRLGTGTLIGNNIYNTTGLNQAKTGAKLRRATITFGISIQNDGTTRDAFKLSISGTTSAMYTVTYWHGTINITASVLAGTFTTPSLAPGKTYLVTVKVKVNASATKGSSTTCLVTITSVGDPTKQDAVSFTGKRK